MPLIAAPGEFAAVPGPLAGARVCVKDVIDIAGVPTGAGSRDWSRDPVVDAVAVARLRAAGAVIAGKGHTNEFAYGIDGLNEWLAPCLNPWDPVRLTGGSTSGPAVAVACGEAEIGLGTDTSGSLRIPAAFCGVWGFRPTHGSVPLDGIVPLAPSLDTCGVVARDARMLAGAMTVLARPSDHDRGETFAAADGRIPPVPWPARIGIVAGDAAGRLAEAVDDTGRLADAVDPAGRLADAVDPAGRLAEPVDAAGLLVDAVGAEPVAVELPDLAEARAAHRVIQGAEAAAVHATLRVSRDSYGAGVAARLAEGSAFTRSELADARTAAAGYRDHVFCALDRAGVSVLALATAPFPAPVRDATTVDGLDLREALLRRVAPLSLLGAPVLQVPIGCVAGLPVGVQVLARAGEDLMLLGLAQSLPL
ncbi:MAG: amidase [Solirubrobacteraceae bacterium]